MSTFDPMTLCGDIASNPDARAAILADRQLGQDAFVERHHQTLRTLYAHLGRDLDAEEARTAATTLWRFIQHLQRIRSLVAVPDPDPAPSVPARPAPRPPSEAQRTTPSALADSERRLHEQRVTQIELELQNEELRGTLDALERTHARYFDLYDLAPVGYLLLCEAGLSQKANLAAATLLNAYRSDLTDRPLSRFLFHEDQSNFYHSRQQLWSSGEPQSIALRVPHQDGAQRWVRLEMSLAPPREGERETPRWRVILLDISEQKRQEAALRESETRFRLLLEQTPSIAAQGYGPDGTVHYWNHAAETLYGYRAEEAIGRNILDLIIPPEMREEAEQAISRMAMTGQPLPIGELSLLRKDGARVAVISSHAVVQLPGQAVELFCLDLDLTDRKRAEEALRKNQELFSLFLHHSPIYIYLKEVTPTQSRVIQASENFQQMIGLSGQEMVGKTMEELFPAEFAAKITADDWAVVTSGEVLTVEEQWNGRQYSSVKFPMVQDGQTLLAGYTLDITERKRLEAAMTRQATTDPLTGAFNRGHFFTVASDELKRARRLKHALSVAFLDLDGLKPLNDTHGHAAGDQALVALAQRCQKNLREIDLFARVGGDEFVVLLPETTEPDAYEVLERIRQSLTTQPMELAGVPMSITISVGIAALAGEQDSLEALLERADQALYQAKRAGRNRVGVERLGELTQPQTPEAEATPRARDADRRHHPRRVINEGVQLQALDATAASSHSARSRDLSEDGMRLVSERAYPARTRIVLAMEDDEPGGDHLRLHLGSVVWARPLPGERQYLLGIKFSHGE